MSRVQLALNVTELDSAIKFYTQMFKTEPHKVRAGYANFEVEDPPLKLVLIENQSASAPLNHLGVEVETPTQVHTETQRFGDLGPRYGDRGRRRLLPRRAGQGLGLGPLGHALGGLHDHRRSARRFICVSRREPDSIG